MSKELIWKEYDKSQLGDWSDVTHRQSFDAGYDAALEDVREIPITQDDADAMNMDWDNAKKRMEYRGGPGSLDWGIFCEGWTMAHTRFTIVSVNDQDWVKHGWDSVPGEVDDV